MTGSDGRGAATSRAGRPHPRVGKRWHTAPELSRVVLLVVLVPILAGLPACSIPRWPVEDRMTSAFGLRFLGWRPGIHRGVDIHAPAGTPVRAMARGRVTFAGVMRGFGKVVIIDHGSGYRSLYAHLSEIRTREGAAIRGHPVIGLSGATGATRGAHLHFEVWRYGRPVDPVPLLGGFPGR